MREKLLTRFLNYVSIDTQSSDESNTVPSTLKQLNLAKILKQELEELGLEDVKLAKDGIVYAKLSKNTEGKKAIGFISHIDTSPEASGENVKPQIHKLYDGKIIKLSDDVYLDPNYFTTLNSQLGKTLITTDGTTLLGADDKAGIAEIMTALEDIITNNVPHGDIYVAFTPDEEIGGGISNFDLGFFKAQFAYTLDGGEPYVINYENFNAASAVVEISGIEVHPGSAKNKMINAVEVGSKFLSMLPCDMKPEYTDNYEGFNHCLSFIGTTAFAKLEFILRNHDKELLNKQKQMFIDIQKYINSIYGKEIVNLNLQDQYTNMKEDILKDMTSVNIALKSIKDTGLDPVIVPIRGGTDGAKLTKMGLRTPNIGTGGYNYHGKYEYAVLEEMQQCVDIVLNIVKNS